MQMPSFARELEGLRDTLERREAMKQRKDQVEEGGEEAGDVQDASEPGPGAEDEGDEDHTEQKVDEVPKGLEAWKEYKRRNAQKEKEEEWEEWVEPSSTNP